MAKEADDQTKVAGKEKDQDDGGPSSVSDGIKRFMDKQSEKAKGKEKDKEPEPSDKKEKDPEKDPKPQPEKTFPKYRIVDEEGNEMPFSMMVDKEEIEVTDPEKLRTYAQLGYHGSQRLEEVKTKEAALAAKETEMMETIANLKTNEAMLSKFQRAIEEGRLVINPPGTKPGDVGKEEVEVDETIDEEIFSEPVLVDLKKENISLKKDMKKMNTQLEAINKLLLGKLVKEQKEIIDTDLKAQKETYPLLNEKEVWNLLAEVGDDGMPVHTVESASKLSHDEETKRFDEFLKENPSIQEKDEESKKAIIAEYLEEKEKREAAPVGSPSSINANPPRKKEKKPAMDRYKNMGEALADMKPWLKKRMEAAKKL